MLLLLLDATAAVPLAPGSSEFAAWADVLIRQGPTAVIAFFVLFKLGPKIEGFTRASYQQTRMMGNALLALKRLDQALTDKITADMEDAQSERDANNSGKYD